MMVVCVCVCVKGRNPRENRLVQHETKSSSSMKSLKMWEDGTEFFSLLRQNAFWRTVRSQLGDIMKLHNPAMGDTTGWRNSICDIQGLSLHISSKILQGTSQQHFTALVGVGIHPTLGHTSLQQRDKL